MKSSFYRSVCRTVILLWITACVPSCGNSQDKMTPSLLIFETQIDLSNRQGENVTSCATIYPDGHYQLLRRVQRLDTFLVSESSYEDVLDSSQLDRLEKLINNPEVKTLPTFNQPTIPPASHFIHHFSLKISRSNSTQTVGFVIWRGPNETYSIEGASPDIRDAQFTSERILKPSVEWFHSLAGHKLEKGEAAKISCQ